MKSGALITLSSICSLNMGQSPVSSSYNQSGDGLPFFQGNADFGELHPKVRYWCNSPTKIAHEGDILISVRAPIGALNIATEDCCIGRGLAALTAKDGVSDTKYLFYALHSRVDELISNGTGSTFKAISKTILGDTLVPVADLKRQIEIAGKIDKANEIIALRRQQLRNLDLLVKSQFIEMFGDPVTNPMRWDTMTLRQASLHLSDGPFGSNLKSEHYRETGVRVIRLQNIGVGEFLDKDKAYVSNEHHQTIKKYTCKAGDIVIGTLGEPNLRACIIPKSINYAINKADCVHYIPKLDILNTIFVCQYINSPSTLTYATGSIHGNTRQRISSGQVAELPIFMPPLDLQNQFAAFVKQVDKSKFAMNQSLKKLEQCRDALLQEAFG